jgi:osmotically-inducible protein OsmY
MAGSSVGVPRVERPRGLFLDGVIAEKAETILRANPYLALKNISCDVQDGVLTLRGYLPSYYLKQMAQEAVATTDGVARIDNQIDVLDSSERGSAGRV